MDISKIKNAITSSNIAKQASKKVSTLGQTISNKLDGSDKFDKFIKKVEPTNHDNAFIPLATLMIGTVIVPRVITASKRNPDDKQATKDEIAEILFRDVQTVGIILFLLKALNAVVGNGATKLKGLPMVNHTYEKLFTNGTQGGFFEKIKAHAKEFAQAPLQKVKVLGKNILDTFNPMGGTRALTNDEFVSKYARGYNTPEEISKFFDGIQQAGGDKNKVFNRVIDTLITLQDNKSKEAAKLGEEFDGSVKKALISLKEKGVGGLNVDENELAEADKKAFSAIKGFFADKNNALVQDSIKVNAWMNGICLAIESLYLGFGLPALNQKRLEKKYLSNDSKATLAESKSYNSKASFVNQTIKPQEIKLYQNFVKD